MNRRKRSTLICLTLLLTAWFAAGVAVPLSGRSALIIPSALAAGPVLPNPILFVTQVPTPYDVLTTVTIFGNHTGDVHAAGRGGDLYIRYPDGTLKNLTASAGYGVGSGFQGATAIAVRDPSVSWDGTKALFSMVIGAPTQPTSNPPAYFWQIYEISGLGQSQTPVITKVPHQPANYNNISPIYGTNGRIIFTSDRPSSGQAHLYPLLDEYNMRPTNTGLWSLDPVSGDLFQLDQSPSGDFTPLIDSFGRVIFTRWDHMERDQQADFDALSHSPCKFCTFNYSDETAQATNLMTNTEVFPEPRPQRTDLLAGTNMAGHHMNEFFPWQINEDGTGAETLNHIGRHELLAHIPAAFTNDPNLQTLNGAPAGAFNQYRISAFLQIKEDPTNLGTYYGVDAKELTHGSGQIISLNGLPTTDADQMAVTYITHRETYSTTLPLPNSTGHYRDPLPMSDGTLIAAHTTQTSFETYQQHPTYSAFDFRLKTLAPQNGFMAASQLLTAGLPTKTLDYYDGTTHVSFTNLQLWELQPVELRARTIPSRGAPLLGAPEQVAFAQAGVSPTQLQTFLRQNNLALVVSRNVTTRDHSDIQQPYRLQVGTTGAQTAPGSGTLYHIAFLQFFQADQLRGLTGSPSSQTPQPGRRVLAEPLHDPTALQYALPNASGPAGSVVLGNDGSMAAFVPARRALTWQMTAADGTPVVRERFWLTMQPGEMRVCASCHGLNQTDQTGQPVPTNTPAALTQLLQYWQTLVHATPTLISLSPASAAAGGPAFTLTINGTNFAANATVQWNASDRPTHFISSTQLTADITIADIQNAGGASVTVVDPATAAVSNALPFSIVGTQRTYLSLLIR